MLPSAVKHSGEPQHKLRRMTVKPQSRRMARATPWQRHSFSQQLTKVPLQQSHRLTISSFVGWGLGEVTFCKNCPLPAKKIPTPLWKLLLLLAGWVLLGCCRKPYSPFNERGFCGGKQQTCISCSHGRCKNGRNKDHGASFPFESPKSRACLSFSVLFPSVLLPQQSKHQKQNASPTNIWLLYIFLHLGHWKCCCLLCQHLAWCVENT